MDTTTIIITAYSLTIASILIFYAHRGLYRPWKIQQDFQSLPNAQGTAFHKGKQYGLAVDFDNQRFTVHNGKEAITLPASTIDYVRKNWINVGPLLWWQASERDHNITITTKDANFPELRIPFFKRKDMAKALQSLNKLFDDYRAQNAEPASLPPEPEPLDLKKTTPVLIDALSKKGFTRDDARKMSRQTRLYDAIEYLYFNFNDLTGRDYDGGQHHKFLIPALSHFFLKTEVDNNDVGYAENSISSEISKCTTPLQRTSKTLENNK